MNNKIAILVIGPLRTFNTFLFPFLNTLPNNYDIFMAISEEDTTYITNNSIILNNRIKKIIIEKNINIPELSKKQNNILSQWYKIQTIFNTLSNKYNIVIRCRTDMNILCSVNEFTEYCNNINENSIYIPYNCDFNKDNVFAINDHFAIGTYKSMMEYCLHYNFCLNNILSNISSEELLYSYLINKKINIIKINLNYKLILTSCFTYSICGDSGSGKSYVSKLIQDILPFDNSLLFETDRYHKWERGDINYNNYTHLHPNANYLEKMSEDIFNLHLGEDIFTVDYDHNTGKFTEIQTISPKQYIIFCGLHTLYSDKIINVIDLKIYIDTDNDIKLKWKIERDTKERGHNINNIINTIEKRKNDFNIFIRPQIENANMIIKYTNINNLQLEIKLKHNILNNNIINLLHIIGIIIINNEYVIIQCYSNITSDILHNYIKEYTNIQLQNGYNGIIQYIILLLTYLK